MTLTLNRWRRTIVLVSIFLAGALVVAVAPAAISADENDDSGEGTQFQPITITEDTFLDLETMSEEFDPVTLLMVFMQLENLADVDTDLSEDSFSEVDSLDDIEQHLGTPLLVPDGLPDGMTDGKGKFGVGESGSVTAIVDVQVARSITQLLDLPVEWLPESSEHDTLTISLDVPASGMAAWRSGLDMLIVGQVDMPEIDVPDEMDLELLRDAIIDDPRMPDELADQLGAIDNWDETVPVPVPEGADYEDVTIDGNAGFILTMDDEGGVLAWEDDGTLHVVAGNLTASDLEQIAESIQ
jgi:hypothetical protein